MPSDCNQLHAIWLTLTSSHVFRLYFYTTQMLPVLVMRQPCTCKVLGLHSSVNTLFSLVTTTLSRSLALCRRGKTISDISWFIYIMTGFLFLIAAGESYRGAHQYMLVLEHAWWLHPAALLQQASLHCLMQLYAV